MFEKEEKELERLNTYFKDLSIPDDFGDQAIMKGIRKASKLKKRNRQINKMALLASILLFSFITSVKVSETMAAYVVNVPGMEKVVSLIRNDKGLLSAAENDYIQKVGVTDSHDGLKVSLDSVIHDERNLIVFYKYEATDESVDIFPKEIQLRNSSGEELPFHIEQGTIWTGNKGSLLEVRFPLSSEISLPENLNLSFKFRLGSGESLEKEWNLPFTLDKDKFAEKKIANLDKKVMVEDQEITIKKITMYPSQSEVHVNYNADNSKRIFGFNDLQLVDENGEVWNSTGVKTERISESESIFYLESNYFKKPKELYLTFNSIRALSKDELWVEIDPENEKIVKAPKDGKISKVEKQKDELLIKLETRPYLFKEDLFLLPNGAGYYSGDNYIMYSLPYSSAKPIKLELLDYPASINSQKEVRIKVK
jgi:hypothetical protein